MGADAVSMHVKIGAESEEKMLADIGTISIECMEWGMPLLAMMYPRGKNIAVANDIDHVKLAARVAAELGADISRPCTPVTRRVSGGSPGAARCRSW